MGTRFSGNKKKAKLIKSYVGHEIVDNSDCLQLEGTPHMEEDC